MVKHPTLTPLHWQIEEIKTSADKCRFCLLTLSYLTNLLAFSSILATLVIFVLFCAHFYLPNWLEMLIYCYAS